MTDAGRRPPTATAPRRGPTLSWLALVTAVALTALAGDAARAIVINDPYFASSGGDPADVRGTLDAGYNAAFRSSLESPFQVVGTFGHCTGTWIGNDPAGEMSYFLTAAHCFDDSQTQTPASLTFTDYRGETVAAGVAVFHVPPERVDRPAGFGGASTDIGILELSSATTIIGDDGQRVRRPVLYDGGDELGALTTLLGYGAWGIGSRGSDGGLFPSATARRARGTNRIDSIFENAHGIAATFNPPGSGDATTHESAVAAGDSGSAWWQQHNGVWTIVGTTNGGSGSTYGNFSTAARVSRWADWVRSVYPTAQFWSDSIPTGVAGDVNQDGVVSAADSDALVAGWREPTYGLPVAEAIRLGDLNLDGITNLRDVAELQTRLRVPRRRGESPHRLPEPSALALFAAGSGLAAGRWASRRTNDR